MAGHCWLYPSFVLFVLVWLGSHQRRFWHIQENLGPQWIECTMALQSQIVGCLSCFSMGDCCDFEWVKWVRACGLGKGTSYISKGLSLVTLSASPVIERELVTIYMSQVLVPRALGWARSHPEQVPQKCTSFPLWISLVNPIVIFSSEAQIC